MESGSDDLAFGSMIGDCKTLDELIELLKIKVAPLQTSAGKMYPNQVIEYIMDVREGRNNIEDNKITRSLGIRDKVAELLPQDRGYRKMLKQREINMTPRKNIRGTR